MDKEILFFGEGKNIFPCFASSVHKYLPPARLFCDTSPSELHWSHFPSSTSLFKYPLKYSLKRQKCLFLLISFLSAFIITFHLCSILRDSVPSYKWIFCAWTFCHFCSPCGCDWDKPHGKRRQLKRSFCFEYTALAFLIWTTSKTFLF